MTRTFGRVAALLTAFVGLVIASESPHSAKALALHPQTQPPAFSTSNRTVAIYATVTNPRGHLVADLTRDRKSVV